MKLIKLIFILIYLHLQFNGITEQDEGRYLCKAVNNVGDAESVAEVMVIGKI
jgi:hypothetical protein